eukprot:TRINITY_DN16690_c0_g1_i1.p1 TRINITY_DN16690_c0_g1~~TRINITY_DN16690_c0_g1_i1.p1  ORF type:complete len:109 (+),score=33.58 TRINITY_DN16690_c0_g1_i1:34-327(+)
METNLEGLPVQTSQSTSTLPIVIPFPTSTPITPNNTPNSPPQFAHENVNRSPSIPRSFNLLKPKTIITSTDLETCPNPAITITTTIQVSPSLITKDL